MSYSTDILSKLLSEVREMSLDDYNKLYEESKQDDVRILTENYSIQVARTTISYIAASYALTYEGMNASSLSIGDKMHLTTPADFNYCLAA